MGKTLTVLERIEQLEKGRETDDGKFDYVFNQIRDQLGSAMEALEASIGVLEDSVVPDIKDKLDAKVKQNREKRRQEKIEKDKQQLNNMLEMGVLKTSATINEKSLVVARTLNAENEVLGSGREQFEFVQLHPDVKPKFLGQEVGFIFENNGQKVEVLEIYEVVPQNEIKTSKIDPTVEAKVE